MITKISEIKIPKKCPRCENPEIQIETAKSTRSFYIDGKFNARHTIDLELRVECDNCGVIDEVDEK